MTKLTELHKRVKAIADTDVVQKKIFEILRDNSRILLTPQRNQLFYKSTDAEGKPLGFYTMHRDTGLYGTAEQWDREGQPFTMVNTGGFRRGIYQIVTPRAIYITSDVPYLDDMVANEDDVFLSTDFFGITDKNWEERVIPRVRAELNPWLVDYLFKLPIVT